MQNQTQVYEKPSRRRRGLGVLGIAGLFVVVVVVGAWALFPRKNMTGLDGMWRDTKEHNLYYTFQPDGSVDAYSGGKDWWRKIASETWSGKWQRDGQRITVQTDRNWDFVGQLDNGTIHGQTIIRDETGATVRTVDSVWQKE